MGRGESEVWGEAGEYLMHVVLALGRRDRFGVGVAGEVSCKAVYVLHFVRDYFITISISSVIPS